MVTWIKRMTAEQFDTFAVLPENRERLFEFRVEKLLKWSAETETQIFL